MAFVVYMNPIGRHRKVRILFPLGNNVVGDRCVQINHHLNAFLLLDNPLCITSQHLLIIVFIDREPGKFFCLRATQFSLFAQRQGIKGRRCHQNQLRPRLVHLINQPLDSLLVRGKAFFTEGIIDSIVHPVAGHDDIWFYFVERPVQSFVNIGPRKRMIRFRESASGFTRQSQVDHLR